MQQKKIEWEEFYNGKDNQFVSKIDISRTKVPGGWLVVIPSQYDHYDKPRVPPCMTFVPDPRHDWLSPTAGLRNVLS